MRIGLLVTTYERPDALARVLESVARQTRSPDEVVVADDGSGAPTAAVVAEFASRSRCRVEHAWQPHEGFRVARARNAGLARLRSDYVLLVDGDMVLHAEFVADHVRAARPGTWVQGCRLPLDAAATARVLAGDDPSCHRRALDPRHRLQATWRPRLAGWLRPLAPALLAVKACNQGHWRRDLERVNGYDESLTGWGAEDKELCARLANAGVRARGLLWAALAWHLHHPPADRRAAGTHRQRLADTRATRRIRAEYGLDRHSPTG